MIDIYLTSEDKQELIKQPAKLTDIENLRIIDEPAKVYLDKRLVLIYASLPAEHSANIRRIAKNTKISTGTRLRGLKQSSSVFGFIPRDPLRNDYCRATRNSIKEKAHFAEVKSFCAWLTSYYKQYVDIEPNEEILASILPEWKIDNSIFTTVNFNYNQRIKYHKDTYNGKNAWSNVIIASERMDGGELMIPELGIALKQRNNALVIFKGAEIIHGVCALRPQSPDAYRCSIVCYALPQLKHCLPFNNEIAHAQMAYTEKARRQAMSKAERLNIIGTKIER